MALAPQDVSYRVHLPDHLGMVPCHLLAETIFVALSLSLSMPLLARTQTRVASHRTPRVAGPRVAVLPCNRQDELQFRSLRLGATWHRRGA